MNYFIRQTLLSMAFFMCAVGTLCAQDIFTAYAPLFTPPKQYVAHALTAPLKIDGQALETDWANVPWSDDFVDIEGALQPNPPLQTRVKMLWDSTALYIYAELEEPHLWATLKEHDAIIYRDNDFEVFVDPSGTSHNYFEFEINAFGTEMDLYLPRPYRDHTGPLLLWSPHDVPSAIWMNGSLNNPDDTDTMWSVEMAIPFDALTMGINPKVPKDGAIWRINFSRVEYDMDIKNHAYEKRKDPQSGKPLPEHNWVWSPQGVINMHCPERWGYVMFSTAPPKKGATTFTLSPDEDVKAYLWLAYYKQADYKKAHGQYATTLKALGLGKGHLTIHDKAYRLSLEGTSRQYIITLTKAGDAAQWQITHDGHLTAVSPKKHNK